MRNDEAHRIFMPYCLQRLDSGKWVVLNRNYKPLGYTKEEWVEYEQYAVPLKISVTEKKKISFDRTTGDTIWLYNDGCVPTSSSEDMQAYSKRLEVLSKLSIKD